MTTSHPALGKNNVAVITGGADGIGLAAAKAFAELGMRVCIADLDQDKAEAAARSLGNESLAVAVDVGKLEDLQRLKELVFNTFGQVDILMNNAGRGVPCTSVNGLEGWQNTVNTNLLGVIYGIQIFAESMLAQKTPGLIINTGSKQGITLPPGNPAYNVSKAGVKAVTECLQHDLRNMEDCRLSAHLLVPGFTYSGMIRQFIDEKPDAAWTCEQVIAFMFESIERGDFYIICPDNDVDRPMDNKRMAWTVGDVIENRPPLSRWHEDYQTEFEKFMQE